MALNLVIWAVAANCWNGDAVVPDQGSYFQELHVLIVRGFHSAGGNLCDCVFACKIKIWYKKLRADIYIQYLSITGKT